MRYVTIRMVIDVVGALEAEALAGHLSMFDNNRLSGSRDQNTDRLSTAVAPGDRIIWSLVPIECESYVALSGIDLPAELCEVTRHTYPGTSVTYWMGVVKQPVGDLSYGMTFELGIQTKTMSTDRTSRLIDAVTGTRRSATEIPETAA